MSGAKKQGGKVVSLERHKLKNLVLYAFDKINHEVKRDASEKRAEVQRKARERI